MKFNEIISNFKKYRWNSLFFKYFRVIFSVILVSVLIMYIIILYFSNEIYTKKQSVDFENNANTIHSQLDDLFGYLNSTYQFVSSDDVVLNYLLTNDDISKLSLTTSMHLGQSMTSYMYSENQHINSIFLYSYKNNYVFSTKYSSAHLDEFFDLTWYKHYNNPNRTSNIIFSPSPHPSVPSALSVIYPIQSGNSDIGILVFNLDIDAFFTSFINGEGNAIIYDSNKNIIYSYSDPYTDTHKFNSTAIDFPQADINNSNISLHIAKSHKTLFRNYSVIFIVIITFLLCIATAFALALYISSILYNSIAQIISNVQFILEGHLPQPNDYEEISSINRNILQLVSKSNAIERDLSKKIVELNKTNIQSMQLQINPHFLFNTLNSMNIIAMTKCSDGTLSKMIMLLSDILNDVIDSTTPLVSIHSELDYTKKYVDILLIRELNSFEVNWDIPPQLSNYKVPKFCIQPLVENAFEHGIKQLEKNEKKVINIKITETKNDIIIEVTNTGPLIPQIKLSDINKRLSDAVMPNKKHIGLKNINIRIKLIYGEEYGCHLLNTDSGVTSIITIPRNDI